MFHCGFPCRKSKKGKRCLTQHNEKRGEKTTADILTKTILSKHIENPFSTQNGTAEWLTFLRQSMCVVSPPPSIATFDEPILIHYTCFAGCHPASIIFDQMLVSSRLIGPFFLCAWMHAYPRAWVCVCVSRMSHALFTHHHSLVWQVEATFIAIVIAECEATNGFCFPFVIVFIGLAR